MSPKNGSVFWSVLWCYLPFFTKLDVAHIVQDTIGSHASLSPGVPEDNRFFHMPHVTSTVSFVTRFPTWRSPPPCSLSSWRRSHKGRVPLEGTTTRWKTSWKDTRFNPINHTSLRVYCCHLPFSSIPYFSNKNNFDTYIHVFQHKQLSCITLTLEF